MNINDAFPSKWLKENDLKGQPRQVTIERVTMEKVGDKNGLVLYFQGKQKQFGCNKTNAKSIARVYGIETDKWAGKTITVFPTTCEFRDDPVYPCIRVRVDQAPAGIPTGSENPTVQAAELPPDYTPDLPPEGDEIPF